MCSQVSNVTCRGGQANGPGEVRPQRPFNATVRTGTSKQIKAVVLPSPEIGSYFKQVAL